jgi:uncharacterized membrane protein
LEWRRSSLKEFIWKYLVGAVVADAKNVESAAWKGVEAFPGYNPYNTLMYVLVALVSLYVVYRFMERNDFELDAGTALNSIPFLLLGGTLRFMEDAGILPFPYSAVLVTPLIYFLIAAVYIPAVYLLDEKRLAYLGVGILTPVLLLALTGFKEFRAFYLVASLALTAVLTAAYKFFTSSEYSTAPMTAIAASQFFGGAAAMNASFYGYAPKQLLAQTMNGVFGPPGVLIMKFILVVAAARVLVDMKDQEIYGIALLVLYTIGFATGFRVLLRATAGI